MNYKDLFIRFILGGGAVALSYLVTIVSPWEILSGIFAAFPAVMITAVLMVGLSSGSKNAAIVANGSVFGMMGCVVCVATVWTILTITGNWPLSIVLGLIFWLGSAMLIAKAKERLANVSVRRTKNIVVPKVHVRSTK